mgnify:CR=1 FL=1
MKLLVCISKVPDTTSKINFVDNDTKFDENGVQYIVNPYDEWYALVRALEIVEANGVIDEFKIAHQNGCICIPIGLTNYASRNIFNIISEEPDKYYDNPDIIMPILRELADEKTTFTQAVKILKDLLKTLKK